MTTEEKKAEKIKHLKEREKSGLSIREYCKKTDLNESTFRYWINKDKEKVAKPKLTKLDISRPLSITKDHSFSLKYASYEILIPSAFNKIDLNSILDVLEGHVL